MTNRKQIILEATAKHLRHAMQGLRDILAKGADLDELKSQSAYEHPFTHGGFTSREMRDASSEDHAHLLRYLFGKPVSYMPSTHLKPQTFNINKIREIQGPLPAGNRYSHLGNVWEPKPRSVVWHSITRAQNQIARSIYRLMAKHPGHDHPDAPIFNAQINSHSQTWETLEAAKEKMRFGALSDVGHPLDDQFYYNYETHGPAVRAQLQDVKTTIDAAAKLFGRRAVKTAPKALPPGSEEQKIQKESVNLLKFSKFLREQEETERAMTNDPAHFAVHGMGPKHLDWISSHPEVLEAKGPVTLTLPKHLDPVPSALVGPAAGHAPVSEGNVYYTSRGGGRNYNSRMVRGEHNMTRTVTVISRPHKETGKPFVITAFGGPLAPKEVDDPTHTPESREESRKFWSQHALLDGKKKD